MKKLLLVLVVVSMASLLFTGCFPTTNIAPVITSNPIETGIIGTAYTYTVTATDADGDTLTYAVVGPTGMVISTEGIISGWTPTVAGSFAVMVTVSDGKDPVTQSFAIAVSAVEPEPEPVLTLTGIAVLPKTMDLFVEDKEIIKSVTASYEFRSYGVLVDLKDCLFLTSDSTVATVKKVTVGVSTVVTVTAVKVGTANILVSYKDKTDTLVVTVKEKASMEIITNIPKFIVKVPTIFTISTIANSDVNKNVKFYFTLPEGVVIEYWEVAEGSVGWITLPLGTEEFGPTTGFPLGDVTTYFRGNFSEIGTYLTTIECWEVSDAGAKVTLLGGKFITLEVLPPLPPTF